MKRRAAWWLLWSDKTSKELRRRSRRLSSPCPIPPPTSCFNTKQSKCSSAERPRKTAKTQMQSINARRTLNVCVWAELIDKCWLCCSCCCSGCNARHTHTHTRPGCSSLPPCKSLGSRRRIRKTNSATSSPQHRQPGRAVCAAAANTSAWKMSTSVPEAQTQQSLWITR